MSDDLLRDAARALHGGAAGRSGAADATRMRIVGSVRAARRRRVVAARASAVLLCAALGGTAWAAATGRLPSLPRLAEMLGVALGTESIPSAPPDPSLAGGPAAQGLPAAAATADAASEPGGPPQPAPSATAVLPSGPASAAGAAPVTGTAPTTAAGAAASASGAAATAAGSTSGAASTTAASATGATPTARAEGASDDAAARAEGAGVDAAADALYKRAHALHFGAQDPAGALRAWDAYLAAAPTGRFAAFAHYNRGLCLLRLGRTAEARRVLQVFASGGFGGYRRAEAQSLLDALEPVGP